MSPDFTRRVAAPALLAVLALAALRGDGIAQSAVELPGITVTAPRHAARPVRTARPAARAAPGPLRPAASPPERPANPARAVVATASATRVPGEDIRREGGGSLGDLLFGRPGVTGSGFAPGAASRPILRGLDGNRVGIVENGIAAGGVSDLGEDHFVPVDPLATSQVEIIRGPGALRYGSTAIGGLVSATSTRIPNALPPCAASQAGARDGCVSAETRTAFSSVDRGIEGAVLLDAGGGGVALHADAYGRKTGDYNIPAQPSLSDPTRPFNGRQVNSATQSSGASIGGSSLFDGGFFGAAITQTNSIYRIPGVDGADHQTRIDAHQTKVTARGEYRPDAAAIDAIRLWAGATDYRHNEIGLATPGDLSSDGVRQTFTNREQEARVEVQLAPFNARFAAITTSLGMQAGHQRLTATSPDDPGSLYNGLFNPNSNSRVAGYTFNEVQFTPSTKAQVAARIEHVALQGTMLDFPAGFLPDGSAQFPTPRHLAFTPKSVSFALLQNLPGELVASVTAQHIERAPKPGELFSRGSHDATATFDIGNPDLKLETAQTIEAGLRRTGGPFRFEATAYYTRFSNFIYRRLTGVMCGEDFASCGNGDPGNEGRQAIYSQRDAIFRGGELQGQLDVGAWRGGVWGIEGQADVVRATFTDGTNVPRIPPLRLGGGLFWRETAWQMRVNLLHAFPQTRIATAGETPTPGYNLLKAEISYRTSLDPRKFGARELLVGVVGNNLLNESIRNAVSYTKDEVLMPGLNVRVFANLKF